MLLPEELYSSLPRKVPLWSPEDVRLWFQLHSVATDPLFNCSRGPKQSFSSASMAPPSS